jgi:hypothetical protein
MNPTEILLISQPREFAIERPVFASNRKDTAGQILRSETTAA